MSSARIGIVALDGQNLWSGGRYYLQHIISAVAALDEPERLPLADVWWGQAPAEDQFREVRGLLAGSAVIRMPSGLVGRLGRRLRRGMAAANDCADLFGEAGIAALFPSQLCEQPGVPVIFWLPDFQHRRLQRYYSTDAVRKIDERFAKHVAAASVVVLSSQDALRDFEQYYPEHADKGTVLRFCSMPEASWWQRDPEAVMVQKQITSPYLIVCNQFSDHKNHQVIFSAVKLLRQRGTSIRVVCTGRVAGFRNSGYGAQMVDFVRTNGLESNILVLGHIERPEQMALVRGAAAVLQPSRFEGWSTIIEDAKTLGKPIIASDIAVHAEQLLGRDDKLLPLDDPAAWADAMLQALQCPRITEDTAEAATRRVVETARACGTAFVRIARGAAGARGLLV